MLLPTSALDPTLVVTVSDALSLQQAIKVNTPYIKIRDHIDLTGINAGTKEEGTLIFPPDFREMVIWV